MIENHRFLDLVPKRSGRLLSDSVDIPRPPNSIFDSKQRVYISSVSLSIMIEASSTSKTIKTQDITIIIEHHRKSSIFRFDLKTFSGLLGDSVYIPRPPNSIRDSKQPVSISSVPLSIMIEAPSTSKVHCNVILVYTKTLQMLSRHR